MKRIIFLDELRGLAILCIMLFHYLYLYNLKYGHIYTFSFNFHWGGVLGIYLFFVISGFATMKSLERIKNPVNFIINRLSKLYPSYWIAMIITYASVSFFGLPGREIKIEDFLVNFSMLQYWSGIPDVDTVYWILPIFLTFYGFIWLILVLNKIKYIESFGILWLILTIYSRYTISPYSEMVLTLFRFIEYSNLFFIGILFYQIQTKGSNIRRNLLIISCLFIQIFNKVILDTVILLIILTIFYLFIFNILTMKNKLLIFIGNISYPLFLLHANIGYILIRKLYSINTPQFLLILIPILIVLTISFAVHQYIEKPSQALIKNYYS